LSAAAKPRIRVRADGTMPAESHAAVAMIYGTGRRDAERRDLSEFSGWNPRVRFAGNTMGQGWETVTGRARDLDENNGWINGGLDRRVEAVIGVNIRLSAQPAYDVLGRDYAWRMGWTSKVQSRFRVWANDIEHRCDARQRLSFGAMAKLAYLTYARDGEAAAEVRDSKRGLTNTTNVLLIEPERISTDPLHMHEEGPLLRDGVRFDKDGAAIGYYVRSGHPEDPRQGFSGQRWDYIPRWGRTGRAKFVHVFSPRRVEQNRGVSRLAEIMVPAKMLDRVDRAEVSAALKSALYSFFIESAGAPEDVAGSLGAPTDSPEIDPWIAAYLDYRGRNPVWVDGAQVTQLLPGEKPHFPDANHPNSNYPDFAKFILQKVAGSLGISYPQLSQDWSGINYSSARALLNELWRSFLEDRHFFTQQFLTPIYAAWLEMEVANGDIKVPGGPANFYRNKTAICMAEWIGPGRGSVDPLKEANADNLDTAAGRKSSVEIILERGRDPVDVMAEESWFLEARTDRKLGAPNHNVKADASADSQDAAGNGGTEEDRDGDGVPLEGKRGKKKEPA